MTSTFKLNLGPKVNKLASAELARLEEFVSKGKGRVLLLTGAGISTESGIPDYRSPTGSYSTGHVPMNHNDFVTSETKQKRFWSRSILASPFFQRAKPNKGHFAVAALKTNGHVNGLITQNVDRLHNKAGFPKDDMVELHGNNDEVVCLSCGSIASRDEYQRDLHTLNQDWMAENVVDSGEVRADGDTNATVMQIKDFKLIPCMVCGTGVLKPHVVFFGGAVPVPVKEKTIKMVDAADRVLVVGSTCSTWSCFRLCKHAAEHGKPLGIVNVGETRADDLAEFKFETGVGDALHSLNERLSL